MVNERRFQQVRINMTGLYNIRAESIKIDLKQDSETYSATNNVEPYAIAFGASSAEIQLSGVDPLHIDYFKDLYNKQKVTTNLSDLPKLSTFGYDSTGQIYQTGHYRQIYIEEMSFENNEPFDVKMSALKRIA